MAKTVLQEIVYEQSSIIHLSQPLENLLQAVIRIKMGCFVQIDDSGRHWLLRRLSHTAHRMLKQETVLSRPAFVFENEWDVLKRQSYECLSEIR